jgi:pimeloyl-ACP methyl ester carboxylesterase
VCCHGLTRNGRDFDVLAQRLASGVDFVPAMAPIPAVSLPQRRGFAAAVAAWFRPSRLGGNLSAIDAGGGGRERISVRVVCPDIVGRGRSEWLKDPANYGYPQYMADMTALLARLGVAQIDWIGTSMGGLIGMFLAAAPNSPIRTLVINDVGPVLPKAALERIADYVGRDERFRTLGELEAHLRRVHAPFGPLTDAQWEHLARHGHRFHTDGTYGLAYDPGIAVNVRQAVKDWDFWTSWDRIACPTLVLRGAQSDLLSVATAEEMTRRGPRAELVTFPGIGHAPALMAADQLEIVAQWLARQP